MLPHAGGGSGAGGRAPGCTGAAVRVAGEGGAADSLGDNLGDLRSVPGFMIRFAFHGSLLLLAEGKRAWAEVARCIVGTLAGAIGSSLADHHMRPAGHGRRGSLARPGPRSSDHPEPTHSHDHSYTVTHS